VPGQSGVRPGIEGCQEGDPRKKGKRKVPEKKVKKRKGLKEEGGGGRPSGRSYYMLKKIARGKERTVVRRGRGSRPETLISVFVGMRKMEERGRKKLQKKGNHFAKHRTGST